MLPRKDCSYGRQQWQWKGTQLAKDRGIWKRTLQEAKARIGLQSQTRRRRTWLGGHMHFAKEGRRSNPVPAHSLLFSKSTKGATRFDVPIRRTNRYQQYYMPSQHTCCGGVWNLIQDCDVQSSDQKVYISTPPSPEVENLLPRRD